jgi:hypothetical protein
MTKSKRMNKEDNFMKNSITMEKETLMGFIKNNL